MLARTAIHNLRSIRVDLLGELTGTEEQDIALEHLQAIVRWLPWSLERLSFNWEEPKWSTVSPSPTAAQGLLERLDEFGDRLREAGIQFCDNRFETSNGHKWCLYEYALAMPIDDAWPNNVRGIARTMGRRMNGSRVRWHEAA